MSLAGKMDSRRPLTAEEEYETLSNTQRLKAAVHYTAARICREVEGELDVTVSRQVIATISETAWRHAQTMAEDLEAFAKHAKRTTITPDDVKMLVRKSPTLHQHLSSLQDELEAGKEEPKKRGRKPKAGSKENREEPAASSVVVHDEDED